MTMTTTTPRRTPRRDRVDAATLEQKRTEADDMAAEREATARILTRGG